MDVIFEEESPVVRQVRPKEKKNSLLTKIVVASGLAKTKEEAQIVLLIFAGLALIISAIILFSAFNPPRSKIPQTEIDAAITRTQSLHSSH